MTVNLIKKREQGIADETLALAAPFCTSFFVVCDQCLSAAKATAIFEDVPCRNESSNPSEELQYTKEDWENNTPRLDAGRHFYISLH